MTRGEGKGNAKKAWTNKGWVETCKKLQEKGSGQRRGRGLGKHECGGPVGDKTISARVG